MSDAPRYAWEWDDRDGYNVLNTTTGTLLIRSCPEDLLPIISVLNTLAPCRLCGSAAVAERTAVVNPIFIDGGWFVACTRRHIAGNLGWCVSGPERTDIRAAIVDWQTLCGADVPQFAEEDE